MSVGFAQSLALDAWAVQVMDVFARPGHDLDRPYLVGSAFDSKEWRDVDVVVILDDDHFAEWFGDWPGAGHSTDPKFAGLMAAFCAWGRDVTGLPIDFKVQQRTDANKRHDGPRDALGIRLYPPKPTEEP